MSLLFYIENFVVVGRIYPLIYTEEKEIGKTLFVEIPNYAIGRIDIRNTVLKEYYLH